MDQVSGTFKRQIKTDISGQKAIEKVTGSENMEDDREEEAGGHY